MTIYIYDNETGRQVDRHTAENNVACEAWANGAYGINDYTWSYLNVPVFSFE